MDTTKQAENPSVEENLQRIHRKTYINQSEGFPGTVYFIPVRVSGPGLDGGGKLFSARRRRRRPRAGLARGGHTHSLALCVHACPTLCVRGVRGAVGGRGCARGWFAPSPCCAFVLRLAHSRVQYRHRDRVPGGRSLCERFL